MTPDQRLILVLLTFAVLVGAFIIIERMKAAYRRWKHCWQVGHQWTDAEQTVCGYCGYDEEDDDD